MVVLQGGLSPITGRSLDGFRLETHHLEQLGKDGVRVSEEKQAIPISEHLAWHLRDSLLGDDLEQCLIERSMVERRLKELTGTEIVDFKMVSEMLGVRLTVQGSRVKIG